MNSFANELDNQVNNLTISEFNNLFNNNQQGIENIKKVETTLGINLNENVISTIVAEGGYNNATVKITTNDGYQFTSNTKQSSLNCSITNDGKSIEINGVTFANDLPTITSFANGIDLENNFITEVSSTEISNPTSSSSNANLWVSSNNELKINIYPNDVQKGLTYFNVVLPTNNVAQIFNIMDLGIDNATIIDWEIKNNPSNIFQINNSNGKQFIFNTQGLDIENIQSELVLTATLKNSSGVIVANGIDVTFHFGKKLFDTSNILLDSNLLSEAFPYYNYGNNELLGYTDVTTENNVINIEINPKLIGRGPVIWYNFVLVQNKLFEAINHAIGIDSMSNNHIDYQIMNPISPDSGIDLSSDFNNWGNGSITLKNSMNGSFKLPIRIITTTGIDFTNNPIEFQINFNYVYPL